MITASLWRLVGVATVLLAVAACTDTSVDPELDSELVLENLTVEGAGVLTPRFDAARARFSVVAKAGSDTIRIRAAGAPGARIFIDGIETASGSMRTVVPAPGQQIQVVVQSSRGRERTYPIVFLPADFPQLSVTNLRAEATETVTFLDLNAFVAAVDDFGVPLYFHRTTNEAVDFKRHPTGGYSYALRTTATNEFGRVQYVIVVLDANFREIDRVSTVGLNHTDNHDFLIRPNGNYVLLAYHGVRRDMTAVGGTANQLVEESVVQEIDRARNVHFQWSSWPTIPITEALRSGSDYAHVNSVFVDADGNFIVSLRGVSQVVKVERATGNVLWRLGGVANQFTFLNDPYNGICGQHTASIVPGGNLLVFDNGQLCPPATTGRLNITRAAEYRLDLTAMTATLVWSYAQPGAYTSSQGSAQRLANGNTLIGWGNGPAMAATEVDSQGVKQWELRAELGGAPVVTYRAIRQ